MEAPWNDKIIATHISRRTLHFEQFGNFLMILEVRHLDCTHVTQKMWKYFHFCYGNIFRTSYCDSPQLQAKLFLQHKYAQIIELVTDKEAKKSVGSIPPTVIVFNPRTPVKSVFFIIEASSD
jgi:predicted N-acyltransferase